MEKTVRTLFTTLDLSLVKQYVQKQCCKLLEDRINIQDCIFAKEYRGRSGYKPGACVPALHLARKLSKRDARSEPRSGERVPYVIVYGMPGLPLIELVRQPHDVISDSSLRINAQYYIMKQILPALNRFLALVGVDVFSWYQQLPRVARARPQALAMDASPKKVKQTSENLDGLVLFISFQESISHYFHSMNCPACNTMTQRGMCDACKQDTQRRALILASRIRRLQRDYSHFYKVQILVSVVCLFNFKHLFL